jgi:signal transduction histidine kinase
VVVGAETSVGGVVLTVADNGVGIAPEYLDRVFDRFAQADDSYARRYGGAGLGLYLAKRMVELHGGTIELASEIDVGTRVTVVLPASRCGGQGVTHAA